MDQEPEELGDDAQPLLCPVCLDLFFQPVTLACGHSYCLSCLTKVGISNTGKQCPACKASWSTIPNENYALSDLIYRKYPNRCKIRDIERQEEKNIRHKLMKEHVDKAVAAGENPVANELKIFLIAIFIAFMLWMKQRSDGGGYYY